MGLAAYGPDAAPALPALLRAIDDSGTVPLHAIRALGAIGPAAAPAVPALMKALLSEEGQIPGAASGALVGIGAPALPALRKALADEREALRRGVAFTLAGFGPEVAADLRPLLKDPEPGVRRVAAGSLLRLGETEEALPILLGALDDAGWRRWVLGTFEQSGCAEPKVVAAIAGALTDEDHFIRMQAARTLAALGPKAKAAIPALKKRIAAEPEEYVREKLGAALKALGE
jgi:HEAT repeat protein